MAARGKTQRRSRLAIAWLLSLAILAAYALLDGAPKSRDVDGDLASFTRDGEGAVDEAARARGPAPRGRADDDDDDREEPPKRLVITQIAPDEIHPGSAIEVRFWNPFPDRKEAITAELGGHPQPKVRLEVLKVKENRVVVRLPKNVRLGSRKLRLRIGDDENARSKPYDFRVRGVDYRRLFGSVVGGLAILVFGLRVLARGTRQYTGNRSQNVLARIGRRTPMAVAFGALVGGVTQFTTTAAGLVVGLVESRLLAVGPAVAVLLGAQLGAAALPSVLGLASAREGLIVIAVGVLWLGFSVDRRSEAFGKVVLGAGFLFFGLFLLRTGLRPLVTDPEIVPYLSHFHAERLSGRLACFAAGALLAAVLQGPGPVAVVVLGLAQTTGQLDLASALSILLGTGLGGAVSTMMVASPCGAEARRMARLHLVLVAAGAALLFATVGIWVEAAEALVPGRPEKIAYSKEILMPKIGSHVVLGFALAQAAVTLALALALPAVARLMQRLAPAERSATFGNAGASELRKGLTEVLRLQRQALEAICELCLTGHRARGRQGEHLLADARGEIETLFGGAVRTRSSDGDMSKLRQAALSTVQLQRALDDLLRQAEKRMERNLALAPAGQEWAGSAREDQTIAALHALLLEGIDSLIAQLESGGTLDLDDARSREIRLNAMESESRLGLLADADRGEESHAIALRLNDSDLVNAYETVGNHLYRLYETMASEIDQETPRAGL